MNNEELLATTDNFPRPFREIPALWVRLFQMTESFFTEEIKHTSVKNTLLGIVILTTASTLLYLTQSILSEVINSLLSPAEERISDYPTIAGLGIAFILCFGLFATPFSFYLSNAISYVSALIFGGKGQFSSQAYLSSLFVVPLGLISSIISYVSLVPLVGIYGLLVTFAIIPILQVIFTVRSFKVIHGFTTLRAVAAVLAPMVFLIIPLCFILVLAAMGPLVGSIFSSIDSQIITPMP